MYAFNQQYAEQTYYKLTSYAIFENMEMMDPSLWSCFLMGSSMADL